MTPIRAFKLILLMPVTVALGCSGFFGGGQQSKPYIPPPTPAPAPEPIPNITEKEAENKAVRDDESRKLRQKSGMSGTVLTSPLGLQAETGSGLGKTLLGRSGV